MPEMRASPKKGNDVLPLSASQAVGGIRPRDGDYASDGRLVQSMPRHSADAGKETPRWFLHLQNMQQSLPSQSSRGRGSLPKVPQLCFAGPQKGGRTNVSQCSVQAQVDRGNAGRWQATALLSKLSEVDREWTAKAPPCTAVQYHPVIAKEKARCRSLPCTISAVCCKRRGCECMTDHTHAFS